MGAARRLVRWIFDWRNGMTLFATALVALLAFVVIDAANSRDQAINALRNTNRQSLAATSAFEGELKTLNQRIADLTAAGDASATELGALRAGQTALEAQIRSLGGRPVVVVEPSSSSTTTSTTTSTTSPPRPAPSTPPTTQPQRCVVGVLCLKK